MKPEKQRLSESESLFCGVRWPKAKQPKRAEALGLLDKVLPWAELEALIRPHFASDKRKPDAPV